MPKTEYEDKDGKKIPWDRVIKIILEIIVLIAENISTTSAINAVSSKYNVAPSIVKKIYNNHKDEVR